MVLAYWHIGREIVEHMQGGEDRAGYGEQVIDDLARRLGQPRIRHKACDESGGRGRMRHRSAEAWPNSRFVQQAAAHEERLAMTLPSATLTRLEKAAVDNGFDQELPRQDEWLGFASTRAPLQLWLSAIEDGPVLAALSQMNVARTLADQAEPVTLPLPAGACAALAARDILCLATTRTSGDHCRCCRRPSAGHAPPHPAAPGRSPFGLPQPVAERRRWMGGSVRRERLERSG